MTGSDIKSIRLALVATGIGLLFSACSVSSSAGWGENTPLLAAGPAAPRATNDAQIGEQLRRSPDDRMMFMERMRVQILHKTRRIPGPRYAHVVRPDLRRQLLAMGFEERDADTILSAVDRAR